MTPQDKDSRTLLPGRDSFYEDIYSLVAQAEANGNSLVLLCIDVIGVDYILSIFGPDVRDEVIRDVGQRIQETIQGDTTPYHITQDRFAIVLLGRHTYRQIIEQTNALVESLRQPFNVSGVMYKMNAYVGISHYPNHAKYVDDLVRSTVFACLRARDNPQKGYATFSTKLDKRERLRFQLMLDLERCLNEATGIRLAYQPKIKLETGECIAAEGLCRWKHDKLGDIPPGDFLPHVEQTSLMLPFTEATLGIGLADLNYKFDQDDTFALAINLSSTLFQHPELLDRMAEQFQFYNINPCRIYFEITETGIMEQPKKAVNILNAIRKWGCKIAVDDFGTGHSSLAYLADLPIDLIKVDRHFTNKLSEPWGEAVMGATAMLADKMGLKTVAEGIETKSQLDKCHQLGITYGQGYYLGRPMLKQEFKSWLENRSHVV